MDEGSVSLIDRTSPGLRKRRTLVEVASTSWNWKEWLDGSCDSTMQGDGKTVLLEIESIMYE
jgi:hypothetical protein